MAGSKAELFFLFKKSLLLFTNGKMYFIYTNSQSNKVSTQSELTIGRGLLSQIHQMIIPRNMEVGFNSASVAGVKRIELGDCCVAIFCLVYRERNRGQSQREDK